MRPEVLLSCTVIFILQCSGNTGDVPDYYNSPYFSDHLHYTLGLCSNDYSKQSDPSFELFLKNELILNTTNKETLRKENVLNLKLLSQWLRTNLRKDLPKRDDFIGYYITLAAWCYPDALRTDDCVTGKYYYDCITTIMASMKQPYENWSSWKRNPFDIV